MGVDCCAISLAAQVEQCKISVPRQEKKIIKEMLLFRPFYSIVTIANKKKNKLLVHVSSESELKPSLFLIIIDCTKRAEKDEKL